jgi:hypothetical protein
MPAWEAPDWPVGDYEIDWLGYENDMHHLVVRAPSNRTGPPGPEPGHCRRPGAGVSKETGEIEYVVAHTEWDRLDAMWPVPG